MQSRTNVVWGSMLPTMPATLMPVNILRHFTFAVVFADSREADEPRSK